GRAFGFDRALDTLGAVLGPVAALWLMSSTSFRTIFLLTLIPGLAAAAVFQWVVREPVREIVSHDRLRFTLSGLPKRFKRYLGAVGIFGAGDFAPTLLILYAANVFSSAGIPNAAQRAVSLYIIYNVVYALASYPVGFLGDRFGKRWFLVGGYILSSAVCVGFILLPSGFGVFAVLFGFAGVAIAVQDSLERALAADLLPSHVRGTGYGALAGLNGIGDFISSAFVGIIWTASSVQAGFFFSAVLKCTGGLMLLILVPRGTLQDD
ncbi:MAG TPA: MFS transporter, partial [Bacteroidota bacterium]|nr:MFS transporter [Bacteroidota bacterium]